MSRRSVLAARVESWAKLPDDDALSLIQVRGRDEVAYKYDIIMQCPSTFWPRVFDAVSHPPCFPLQDVHTWDYSWARFLRSLRSHDYVFKQLNRRVVRYVMNDKVIDLRNVVGETCPSTGMSMAGMKRWCERHVKRCRLSYLDVAVIEGKSQIASYLRKCGATSLLSFETGDFVNLFTGVMSPKSAQVFNAAVCAGIELHNIENSEWLTGGGSLLERAIAGQQWNAAKILARSVPSQVCTAFTKHRGYFLFTCEMCPPNISLRIDKVSLEIALAVGVDLASLRVHLSQSLAFALRKKVMRRMLTGHDKLRECRDSLIILDSEADIALLDRKCTLLESAILLGQKEVAEILLDCGCDAGGLTSADFQSTFLRIPGGGPEWDVHFYEVRAVVQRQDVFEAALAVYRKSRCKYQIVILQAARWWLRKDRCPAGTSVEVLHGALVDAIALFACEMPSLPELTRAVATPAGLNQSRALLMSKLNSSGYACPEEGLEPMERAFLERSASEPVSEMEQQWEEKEVQEDVDSEEVQAMRLSIESMNNEEAAHLTKALLLSKSDALASEKSACCVLSAEDVVVWRLTRTSHDIATILQTSPALESCHRRVVEAQCEIRPTWANGACLLVPLTEDQCQEADVSLRAHNIVSLRTDEQQIMQALMQMSNRQRPKLRPEYEAIGNMDSAVADIHDVSHLDEERMLGDSPVAISVERTFLHFCQGDVSELSTVIQSAPCGSSESKQPSNPRHWHVSDA